MTTNGEKRGVDRIQLSVQDTPGFIHADNLTEASAKKASQLLTANHELYHTRWKDTFHNHLAHHIISLWSLGATPEQMQDMYDFNKTYQSPITLQHDDELAAVDLTDPTVFDHCLGKNDHYADFLNFFKNEIARSGVHAVLREYLLKGDARADDILARMFTDLVHPMIHLGCAIEFNQPSLIAEALAGACVHVNWPAMFLQPTEHHVKANPDTYSNKSLLDIMEGMRGDPIIADGVRDTDTFNKIPDGFLKRVPSENLVVHLSQYRVRPEKEHLQKKLSEMMHTLAYMLAASQRPGKTERLDFVLLHSVTLSVHFPAILAQDWLSDLEKSRLLEAKVRVDAVMYAGCRLPSLYPERVTSYVPRSPSNSWGDLFQRAIIYRDEGHAAKLIRALYVLERLELPAGAFPIEKKDFIKIAHMSLDSIEKAQEPGGSKMPEAVAQGIASRIGEGGDMVKANMARWVFYGGLEKAWDFVPEMGTQPK